MRIAINTRFLLTSKMEGFGWYTYEISKRLVEMHPEHEFFFFFDRPYDEKFVFAKNVTPVKLFPPARHPFLFKIWFNWSVRKALEKYKIDLFFSPDGYLSLTTDVRQVPVIHDLNFEHYPEDLPTNVLNYYKEYFPQFVEKADHILTVSNYSKQDIVDTYGIVPEKITAIWNGASDEFKPLTYEEKGKVKKQFANGNDYFLFVGALHPRKNLIRLVKAYQQFKRKTNSKTKLVIVGEMLWQNQKFKAALSGEHNNDIIFTGHLDFQQLTKVMGAAKVLTYVPYFEGFGIPLAEAMKCGTPILTGIHTSLPEVSNDAAEYCDPFNVDDIANKMLALDMNPTRLKELSEIGIERSKLFSWDKSAKKISKALGL